MIKTCISDMNTKPNFKNLIFSEPQKLTTTTITNSKDDSSYALRTIDKTSSTTDSPIVSKESLTVFTTETTVTTQGKIKNI